MWGGGVVSIQLGNYEFRRAFLRPLYPTFSMCHVSLASNVHSVCERAAPSLLLFVRTYHYSAGTLVYWSGVSSTNAESRDATLMCTTPPVLRPAMHPCRPRACRPADGVQAACASFSLRTASVLHGVVWYGNAWDGTGWGKQGAALQDTRQCQHGARCPARPSPCPHQA